MTNYGSNERPPDIAPSWLLGGHRKWLVLRALADDTRSDGWHTFELVREIGCGRTTIIEIIRALDPLDAIHRDSEGRKRLAENGRLPLALRAMIEAVEPYAQQEVSRPPRGKRRS